MGHFRKLQMCSLRELLEMCPSHKPMVQTNYNYELSSHPISNTQCDFFPGPGIRSWIRATNVQSCSVAPDLPLGISPPVTFKKEVSYSAPQQDSGCKAGLVLSHFSHVRLFATLWTVARQAPLLVGLSRQEYWSELPFPSPGDVPDPGIEPRSPSLQANSLTSDALDARLGTRKFVFPTFLEFQIKSMV